MCLNYNFNFNLHIHIHQIVAGKLYKFDLALKHNNNGGKSCSRQDGEVENCHVEGDISSWGCRS